QRGLIERLDVQGATCGTGACAKCSACGSDHAAAVVYQWRGTQPAALPPGKRPVLMLHPA
ncbi:MAG: FeoC-like transcriptional regulator, partial [Thiomonas sp.]